MLREKIISNYFGSLTEWANQTGRPGEKERLLLRTLREAGQFRRIANSSHRSLLDDMIGSSYKDLRELSSPCYAVSEDTLRQAKHYADRAQARKAWFEIMLAARMARKGKEANLDVLEDHILSLWYFTQRQKGGFVKGASLMANVKRLFTKVGQSMLNSVMIQTAGNATLKMFSKKRGGEQTWDIRDSWVARSALGTMASYRYRMDSRQLDAQRRLTGPVVSL